MGNIGSHSGHTAQKQPSPETEPQWAHSFPRNNPPRFCQHKVLPENDVVTKLRPTDNGEILQSGGTLSGRHQQHRLSLEREEKNGVYRSTSIATTHGHHDDRSHSPILRSYLSNQRDPFHKSSHRYEHKKIQNGLNINYREQMKRFGSEPDLRNSLKNSIHNELQESKDNLFKGKKKYKAPSPPNYLQEKSLIDCENNSSNGSKISPTRRTRLFKTRAEMKKKQSSPVNKRRSVEYSIKLDCIKPHIIADKQEPNNRYIKNNEIDSVVHHQDHENKTNAKNNRLSLPEMSRAHSVPEFQQELKEATRRLRNARLNEQSEKRNKFHGQDSQKDKHKLKTLDHNINKKENIRNKLKQIEHEKESKRQHFERIRGEAAGKDSSPEQSPQQVSSRERKEKEQPSKTFYFGMNDQNTLNKSNYTTNIIDQFTTSLHTIRVSPVAHSSESDISSELDMDDSQVSSNGIALQLRPILPKKQLEIPRFSPAAAWRLLSTMESNHPPSTVASDDGPVFIEERIEKLSRPPPPPTMQLGPRSSHDKSGDSGISGDAGPPGFDDNADGIVINQRNALQINRELSRPPGISWTPQQDLGDDSSLEEGLNNDSNYTPSKLSRPHVFSLSLPRDNHLAAYIGDKSMLQSYTGLQKLKRSVSGVLGTFGNKRDFQANPSQEQSDNWFLSRSAPNSLNNGFNSLELRHSQKSSEEQDQSLVPNTKQNTGRLMYLPELDNMCQEKQRQGRTKSKDEARDRSKSVERSKNNYKLTTLSKSCENITGEVKSSSEPEDLQDPPKPEIEKWKGGGNKSKRFTFQSTVRQIERKRLAEKLSKEAERKEKQRLRELEAMQRVEEEFQKKRAREKASIRQQLRLFSMDDTVWSILPPNLDVKDDVPTRSEPDGAVSSSTNSTPSLPLDKTPKETKKSVNKSKRNSNISSRPVGKYASSSESSDDVRIKPPATQILSEYRQPQREYKEYRGNTRYLNEFNDNHAMKQTTIYPQVTCNMPKAKGHQASNNNSGTSNYRKDFAHGVKNNKSGGSSYSEDSQSNLKTQSPKMYHNKYSPITRF